MRLVYDSVAILSEDNVAPWKQLGRVGVNTQAAIESSCWISVHDRRRHPGWSATTTTSSKHT